MRSLTTELFLENKKKTICRGYSYLSGGRGGPLAGLHMNLTINTFGRQFVSRRLMEVPAEDVCERGFRFLWKAEKGSALCCFRTEKPAYFARFFSPLFWNWKIKKWRDEFHRFVLSLSNKASK
ncbi:hypothetical protein AVEN_254221-1 [Araneus ventricosus]|uniref:Uncharacterized protein n=1 Tax=Araneus ventricosus TaxID=182803 RepID=A0A4Y2JFP2_ARAVE|nr:hypothetical protein AVEN_254221-1 [Araneus ventricosus]